MSDALPPPAPAAPGRTDAFALLVADVYEAAGALRRLGERTAATEGLTQARWQVLSAASEQPVTVPQAARRLGVTRQNVQRVANDLVERGHAAFAGNPEHRGSPLLTLTPTGRTALERVTERAAAHHRVLLGTLPEQDVTAARALLRRLLTELDREERAAAE
ncbi:MarR family winged helix-turn-helix transcriptional regulator [Streptomyces lichenis]|uniref:MarR family winged helix-turn-helix transcriptional regulator n=1 Tax=Streptomyces lichenis TaxID=2306967 RepID=A0ABT0I6S0_9ACTN|nr:MarR family winged helix-turn-helix transcriptional regulator [Streptomyces lichenis]MCK8677005.1 MarR family winged helix-turn-helix transcriptional regulator [Streptomyces lichenis]